MLIPTFPLYSPILAGMSRYEKAHRRVFMRFVRREVWHVNVRGDWAADAVPKTLTFRDEGRIRELARRGEAWQDSESRQMLELAIERGEGGVYL